LPDGGVVPAGPPSGLHDRRQSLFVADVVGFRNFFPVGVTAVDARGVEGTGQGMHVRGRARHPLPPGTAAVAAIRPDDVELGGEGGGANRFRGKVEIVEYLGRENEAVLTL